MKFCELFNLLTGLIREKSYWRVVTRGDICGFGIYDSANPDINDNRYYLELHCPEIKNNKKLITLLMNPSKTFPYENENSNIDDTIMNVIKIARALNISKIVVLNTIPTINSNIELALSSLDKEKQTYNEKFINSYLKHCDKENTIFLATWGSDKNINSFNKYSQIINDNFKNKIYAYSLNDDMRPTHASGYNNAQVNEFLKKLQLIPIKYVNDDLTVKV